MAELEIRNEMFDTVEHRKFLMSLSGRRNHFEIPAETDFCGETCIECQNIWIFDLFKLFRAGGKSPGQFGQSFIRKRWISVWNWTKTWRVHRRRKE